MAEAKSRAVKILANNYRSRTPSAANRSRVSRQKDAIRRVGGTPNTDVAAREEDSRQYAHNLILHADSEGIAVTWDSLRDAVPGGSRHRAPASGG